MNIFPVGYQIDMGYSRGYLQTPLARKVLIPIFASPINGMGLRLK
jgi:hypothetical protein